MRSQVCYKLIFPKYDKILHGQKLRNFLLHEQRSHANKMKPRFTVPKLLVI
jgi:hypothetical protein